MMLILKSWDLQNCWKDEYVNLVKPYLTLWTKICCLMSTDLLAEPLSVLYRSLQYLSWCFELVCLWLIGRYRGREHDREAIIQQISRSHFRSTAALTMLRDCIEAS